MFILTNFVTSSELSSPLHVLSSFPLRLFLAPWLILFCVSCFFPVICQTVLTASSGSRTFPCGPRVSVEFDNTPHPTTTDEQQLSLATPSLTVHAATVHDAFGRASRLFLAWERLLPRA
jgi:hypothetical protein